MEIEVYFRVIRRWLWLLALTTLFAAGVSYYLVQQQAPVYVAQAELLVSPGVDTPNWDLSVLRSGRQVIQAYTELAKTKPVLQRVIDQLHLNMSPSALSGMITITPNLDTLVLNISVRSPNDKQAVAIANGMVNALSSFYSYQSPDGSTGDTTSLAAQASQLQDQIARSQDRIKQLESDFQNLSQSQNKPPFTDAQQKIAALEAQANAPADPALLKRIQDRQARIQQLETALKSTVNFDARRGILDEIASQTRQLDSDNAQLTDQRRAIRDQITQERNRLTTMQSTLTQQLGQIQSQLSNERSQLDKMQTDLAALSSRQIIPISLAQSAAPDSNKTLILLVATLAGLVLGLTLAFTFEYLDDRIRTPEQLAEATGVQVWGSIGRQPVFLQPGQNGHQLPAPTVGRITEAFRWLCMRVTPNTGSNVCSVLVTSFEQEGKVSEIAANLAIMLTRAGKRVTLIDADVRHPSLGKLFQVDNPEGLANWLANGVHSPKLVPIKWASGLSVLPVGTPNGNSVQELEWPRMEDLIKRVEGQTDIVIVAGPPLTASADSFFLASQMGGVLAVASGGKTRRKAASDIIDNLRSMGVPVLGLILADGGKSGFKTLYMPASRGIYSYEQRLLSGPRTSYTSEPPRG